MGEVSGSFNSGPKRRLTFHSEIQMLEINP
jgi:hypothetical protein